MTMTRPRSASGLRVRLLRSLSIAALILLLFVPAILSLRGLRPAGDDRTAASARLGMTVAIEAPDTTAPALLVTSLREDGPADRAGIAVGDEIDRIDGRRPQTLRQVEHDLETRPASQLIVRRHGQAVRMVLPSPAPSTPPAR